MSRVALVGKNCLIGGCPGITILKYLSRCIQVNRLVDVAGFPRILQLKRLRWN